MVTLTYGNGLRNLDAGDGLIDGLLEHDDDVTIDLSRLRFVEPAGMLGFVTACVEAQRMGNTLTIVPPNDPDVANYLLRMHFRDLLRHHGIGFSGPFASRQVRARELGTRLLELCTIMDHVEGERIGGQLYAMGRVAGVPVGFIRRAVVAWEEALDNALEHSGRHEVFTVAQRYQRRIEIAVGDLGVGFLATLKRRYRIATDAQALALAIRPGISGVSAERGNGLPYAIEEVVDEGGGIFLLRSGHASLRLARAGRFPEASATRRDGAQLAVILHIPR